MLLKFEENIENKIEKIENILVENTLLRSDFLFDTYTEFIGDNNVIVNLLNVFQDPKPLRFCLAGKNLHILMSTPILELNDIIIILIKYLNR